MTPDLRRKALRLQELNAQHLAAIRGLDGAFYADGRHEELQRLVSVVYGALMIAPHDDHEAILAHMLE